jgi:DNA-binding response OmpR family regulator
METEAVLVIDDDPDFRELVRIYAEDEGMDVLEAADCVAGIAALRMARDRVAVVLLDYWMPNMEPVRCARHVCSLVRASARVLLVTAAVDARARAAEVGVAEWLSKPFDFEQLSLILRESQVRHR